MHTHSKPRRHSRHLSPGTLACGLALSVCTALPATAAVWEDNTWALLSEADAILGYDSNLDLRRDSSGSAFAGLLPSLTLKRKASQSLLEARAYVNGLAFENQEFDNQVDWGLSTRFAYPYSDEGRPQVAGSLKWREATVANQWLGARIKQQTLQGDLGGRAWSSGKSGLNLGIKGTDSRSADNSVNNNSEGSLLVGAAFDYSPKSELSLNYLYTSSRSRSRQVGIPSVKGSEHTLGLKAEGDILSKLTGSIMVGLSSVRYSDGFTRSDVMPYADADLNWELNPKQSLALSGSINASFSPEGESVKSYVGSATFKQKLFGPWSAECYGFASFADVYRTVKVRNDTNLGLGLAGVCQVNEGLGFRLSALYTTQDSSFRDYTYDRQLVELTALYKF